MSCSIFSVWFISVLLVLNCLTVYEVTRPYRIYQYEVYEVEPVNVGCYVQVFAVVYFTSPRHHLARLWFAGESLIRLSL